MLQSNFLCTLIQGVWMGTCLAETMQFRRAANNSLRIVQGNVLSEILRHSQSTDYGHKHNFARIKNSKDFQNAVPINDYEDLLPWINMIADGQKNVLTADQVLMFEETSGSTAGTRLIPYTARLQQAFNRALHPWLFDLHQHFPGLWGGQAYWVITPKAQTGRRTAGCIPIGFAADSDYFGKWAKPLINALMAVSDDVSKIADSKAWRYYTALSLLRCEELRLISLWNPTFFSALIGSMQEWADELAADLMTGSCKPAFLPLATQKVLHHLNFTPLPQRARLFSTAVAKLTAGKPAEFARILWPKLSLISSWSEAEAAAGMQHLREFFPDTPWQTKGLLATEGAVTLPMFGAPAPVLAARTAFFEFAEGEEGEGTIKLADELEIGGKYRVIMTTFGGLFRYRLHDVVEMRGWWRNFPCLAFLGKEAMVSDLCGEKLNSGHIKNILAAITRQHTTAFLAPEKPSLPELPGYVLHISREDFFGCESELAIKLEKALCENVHYHWCREADQLAAARVLVLNVSTAELNKLRLQRLTEVGLPISTAKFGVLDRQAGWHEWFKKQLSERCALYR